MQTCKAKLGAYAIDERGGGAHVRHAGTIYVIRFCYVIVVDSLCVFWVAGVLFVNGVQARTEGSFLKLLETLWRFDTLWNS